MSDQYSGNRYSQPWLRHYSDQNVLTQTPFTINNRSNYSEPFAINGRGEHLLLHRIPSVKYYIPKPSPNTNSRIGIWGRDGAKAYYRFHGGIGDGRGGIGWATEDNGVARPLQLFEALDPIDIQIDMLKKTATEDDSVKNPVTGSVPKTEASGGTGVFLPRVHPKMTKRWIPSTKVLNKNDDMCASGDGGRGTGGQSSRGRGRGGGGRARGGRDVGKKKQEDNFENRLAEEEKHKDSDEIPIELLLPPEWAY